MNWLAPKSIFLHFAIIRSITENQKTKKTRNIRYTKHGNTPGNQQQTQHIYREPHQTKHEVLKTLSEPGAFTFWGFGVVRDLLDLWELWFSTCCFRACSVLCFGVLLGHPPVAGDGTIPRSIFWSTTKNIIILTMHANYFWSVQT